MEQLTTAALTQLPQVRALGRHTGRDPLTLFWTASGIELEFTGSQFPDLNRCSCTFQEVKRYQNRISGPILDRIDIVAEVSGISYQELTGKRKEKSSKNFRKEVEMAVKVQGERYQEKKIRFNSQLSGKLLEEFCNVSAEGQRILEKAYKKMRLSARAYHKILKTARTIADLEQEEEIKEAHISEALCYRRVEGKDT